MSGCHGTRTQSLGKTLPPRHSNENRPSVEGAVWPGLPGTAVTAQTVDPSHAAEHQDTEGGERPEQNKPAR